MFNYYYLSDGSINQCSVNMDIKRLKELRNLIIDNCSEIKHVITESVDIPEEGEQVYNLKYKMVGKKYDDFSNKIRSLYFIEYDWYEYPKLVTIIDELLCGNVSVLDDFYNILNNIKSEDDVINQLYSELRKAHREGNNQMIRKINGKINAIKKSKEKSPVKDYYLRVDEYINLKVLRSMSVNTLIRVEDFFGLTNAPILTANKILKKERIRRKYEGDIEE